MNTFFHVHTARRTLPVMAFLVLPVVFILLLLTGEGRGDGQGTITGIVTDGTVPLAGAVVKIAATTIGDTTDSEGRFRIDYGKDPTGKLVTAWKEGFYNGGVELEQGASDITIPLIRLHENDNAEYAWVDPAPSFFLKRYALSLFNKNENCGDCHASIIYEQWRNNGHAQAATNPLFMSLYNGTDAAGAGDVQPGFRLDYPHSAGNCANCHAPAAALRNVIGVDMNTLEDVEKLGVSCDFCHKVKDVKMKENTSIFSGVMHMDIRRPPEGHQVFFGPYTDIPHPDAYAPIQSSSLFCAPCHQGSFWGVPIYESYAEWLASPYAAQGITCQKCHMKPDGVTTNFAPGKGGLERDPQTIPSHYDVGTRDSAFLASSVTMNTDGLVKGDTLRVSVAITNATVGHHIPTDQPMRNMILLVRAVDARGKELEYAGTNTVPYWGGKGDPAGGNYEGLPGKGFAKILYEKNPQYLSSSKSQLQKPLLPAPQWRIMDIQSDNRIPAMATDESVYDFLVRAEDLPVTITAELIYRRMFKTWATMKKWPLKDVVLARNQASVGSGEVGE
jgi:nitrate/TMAO reductase-like tetraheme cytochrome c subunit